MEIIRVKKNDASVTKAYGELMKGRVAPGQ
jgi:hypothetical protein